jgi:hypothetical protein
MRVIYARQPIQVHARAIFLAGPTPRDKAVPSWRPEALDILQNKLSFNGTVFVPEDEGWGEMGNLEYNDQIGWERAGLRDSHVVVFWVPRDMQHMPALTTNIEFGAITGLDHQPIRPYVLGYPQAAPKMGYLRYVALEQKMPVHHTLYDTLQSAVQLAAQP